MKPILLLDFDGVCHSYIRPWTYADEILDPPVDGLWDFLEAAGKHFSIHIYSSRSSDPRGIEAMRTWFWTQSNGRKLPDLHFPARKTPAFLTIDDRAITFDGTWPDPEELLEFKPWNRRS